MNKYSLKNRTHISNAIDTELYEQLTQYFKDTDIPVSKLWDRSIRLLLESTKK